MYLLHYVLTLNTQHLYAEHSAVCTLPCSPLPSYRSCCILPLHWVIQFLNIAELGMTCQRRWTSGRQLLNSCCKEWTRDWHNLKTSSRNWTKVINRANLVSSMCELIQEYDKLYVLHIVLVVCFVLCVGIALFSSICFDTYSTYYHMCTYK